MRQAVLEDSDLHSRVAWYAMAHLAENNKFKETSLRISTCAWESERVGQEKKDKTESPG